MALSNSYMVATNKLTEMFGKIRDGQAPEHFSQQLLRDWGFSSSNERAFIPLLKSLGFLSPDGKPTQRYHDYRDHSRSKAVLGQALREAYGDIFLIKEQPSSADRAAIEGKFKSFHNASDNVAGLMTKTFLGLLALADVSASARVDSAISQIADKPEIPASNHQTGKGLVSSGLHYNIQIHLPATKDTEVYRAIFKSLKEHLVSD